MPVDAAWSDGETFNGAFFSSLAALANANEAGLTGKQAADADLTAIAALTPTNDDVLQRKSGAWTNRTPAQLKTDLAVTKGDVGLGNVTNNAQYFPTGTDVALTDGGTGASLVDPNADRIMFWDDSAGAVTWLAPGTNLTITGTTLDATGGGSGGGDASTNTATSVDSEVVLFSGTGGKTLKRATVSGIPKLASGVISTAVAGTDYSSPTSTETQTNKTISGANNILTNIGVSSLSATGTRDSTTVLHGDNVFRVPTGGSGIALVDNGDGTFTVTGAGLTDNGDGTFTF